MSSDWALASVVPRDLEHRGGIIEIAAIGFKRVLGRAALGTHHFKKGFGMGGAEIAHEQTGNPVALLSFSVGTRTVTSRSTGST
jgi:hypothetical protein